MTAVVFYIIFELAGSGREKPQTIWSILLAPVARGLYFTYCVEGVA